MLGIFFHSKGEFGWGEKWKYLRRRSKFGSKWLIYFIWLGGEALPLHIRNLSPLIFGQIGVYFSLKRHISPQPNSSTYPFLSRFHRVSSPPRFLTVNVPLAVLSLQSTNFSSYSQVCIQDFICVMLNT